MTLADALIATGDSSALLIEACATSAACKRTAHGGAGADLGWNDGQSESRRGLYSVRGKK